MNKSSNSNLSQNTSLSTSPKTWIFQANPNIYDIHESLRVEQEEYWNLRQHSKEVGIGDYVLIWISGKDAGIYALGKVVTQPVLMSDSVKGQEYWTDPIEGKKLRTRVKVRYEKVFLERPLKKTYLIWDEALTNLSIIKFASGTNFRVTEREWQAIKRWLDKAPK